MPSTRTIRKSATNREPRRNIFLRRRIFFLQIKSCFMFAYYKSISFLVIFLLYQQQHRAFSLSHSLTFSLSFRKFLHCSKVKKDLMLLAIVIAHIFISSGLQEGERKNEKSVNNNYTDKNICNSTSFSSATQKQKFQLKLFDVEKYEREMNGIWKIFFSLFFFPPSPQPLYFLSVFNVKALTHIHAQDESHPKLFFSVAFFEKTFQCQNKLFTILANIFFFPKAEPYAAVSVCVR